MPISQEYIERATQSAAVTLLWQATDATDAGTGFPISEGGNEYSQMVLDQVPDVARKVATFVMDNAALLLSHDLDAGQVGHDLILTAGHHGTGFWDRGLDMPAYDSLALTAYRLMTPAAYLAWRANAYTLLDQPKTVGDVLTEAAHAAGEFDAEFAMNEKGYGDTVVWLMVENTILVSDIDPDTLTEGEED